MGCRCRRRVRDTGGGETKRDRDTFHGASLRRSPGQGAGDLIYTLPVHAEPRGTLPELASASPERVIHTYYNRDLLFR
jgi:hypothetical protein